MKRTLLHLLFWMVYLLQDSMLEFLWVSPSVQHYSTSQQWWMAMHAGACLLLPKLLFTYCVIYFTIPALLQGKRLWREIGKGLLLLCVTIVAYRLVAQYYMNVYVYPDIFKPSPLFSPVLVLFAFMDIGCVSGIAITLKLLRTQLGAKEREKNLVKEKLETELRFLRNQINPHFLFNTLNNIYALARKQSPQTAPVVLKLSQLLRFMLYESGSGQVTVAAEIRVLNDYLELEKIRYNNRLQLQFSLNVDDETRLIAPLLLLPFVENAFKHGVSESRFHSFVHIQLTLQNGLLTFQIENTCENGNAAISDKIGLSNVRRQLQLMYGEHHLQISNGTDTFSVHLTINLNSYAKI
ncbi:sensor histidine kinase [Deminuibacter soli]|uniref:Signal transduction histidine kinase internal region domain-containing protein n=1 Tax=Deminuibacter soli TaxID=2291815 RepID=A0A3E1NK18_9BACT|nr:histidine kinase [Deminuibacter soli]RFM28277.1 hypothetical protein DXN05_12250 [Deminuibacter soli]